MSSGMGARSDLTSSLRRDRRRGGAWALTIAAALAGLCALPAAAQAPPDQSPGEICLAANGNLSLGTRLPRMALRHKTGGPLIVVAIGSSSTTGLWVYGSSATYPEVMKRELARLRPKAQVAVVNSGRIGDTIPGSIARFDRDVFSYAPDLVVWQLGTNDVAWGGSADGAKDLVVSGVRSLKASGADVVLMDLQYAPLVLSSSHHATMLTIIADAARQERVGLFSRFELMRRSVEAGVPRSALLSWDGFHNSIAGYDCVGRALARAVHAAGR